MLGGLLSTKTMLGMIKGIIEKQLKISTDHYRIEYSPESKKIDFVIDIYGEEKRFLYEDSETLAAAIELQVREKLENENIDYVQIFYYDKKECTCKVFYTNESNEKKFIEELL